MTLIIMVEGNVAAGKSTLVKRLSTASPTLRGGDRRAPFVEVFEETTGAAMQRLFYADPPRYGFALQLAMRGERAAILSHVYAEALYAHSNAHSSAHASAHSNSHVNAHASDRASASANVRDKQVPLATLIDRSVVGCFAFAAWNTVAGNIARDEFAAYCERAGHSPSEAIERCRAQWQRDLRHRSLTTIDEDDVVVGAHEKNKDDRAEDKDDSGAKDKGNDGAKNKDYDDSNDKDTKSAADKGVRLVVMRLCVDDAQRRDNQRRRGTVDEAAVDERYFVGVEAAHALAALDVALTRAATVVMVEWREYAAVDDAGAFLNQLGCVVDTIAASDDARREALRMIVDDARRALATVDDAAHRARLLELFPRAAAAALASNETKRS